MPSSGNGSTTRTSASRAGSTSGTAGMRNRSKIGLVVAAALAAGGGYLFLYEPAYSGSIRPAGQTLVFGHRGFGNHAPDNSLVAARMAMEAGLDGVDMDGQRSSD